MRPHRGLNPDGRTGKIGEKESIKSPQLSGCCSSPRVFAFSLWYINVFSIWYINQLCKSNYPPPASNCYGLSRRNAPIRSGAAAPPNGQEADPLSLPRAAAAPAVAATAPEVAATASAIEPER